MVGDLVIKQGGSLQIKLNSSNTTVLEVDGCVTVTGATLFVSLPSSTIDFSKSSHSFPLINSKNCGAQEQFASIQISVDGCGTITGSQQRQQSTLMVIFELPSNCISTTSMSSRSHRKLIWVLAYTLLGILPLVIIV
jgi:hypothetical protein